MVFKPGQSCFLASPRLCICNLRSQDYGSCELFSLYQMDVHQLRNIPLRSDDLSPPEVIGEEDVDGFITQGSYVAIAAHQKSTENIWFIKVNEVKLCSSQEQVDDYGHIIPAGTTYLPGNFLERTSYETKSVTYKMLNHKVTYFYKESVVFPFVNFAEGKKGYILTNGDYTGILMHVEQNGLVHL